MGNLCKEAGDITSASKTRLKPSAPPMASMNKSLAETNKSGTRSSTEELTEEERRYECR